MMMWCKLTSRIFTHRVEGSCACAFLLSCNRKFTLCRPMCLYANVIMHLHFWNRLLKFLLAKQFNISMGTPGAKTETSAPVACEIYNYFNFVCLKTINSVFNEYNSTKLLNYFIIPCFNYNLIVGKAFLGPPTFSK